MTASAHRVVSFVAPLILLSPSDTMKKTGNPGPQHPGRGITVERNEF